MTDWQFAGTLAFLAILGITTLLFLIDHGTGIADRFIERVKEDDRD